MIDDMTVLFDIYGDSHLDEFLGIGARMAVKYEANFRHDVQLRVNNAKAGSQVSDWISNFLKAPVMPDVLVVSSGFNEAVAIQMGMTTLKEVRNYWKLLIAAVNNSGSKVLWVPTQYQYGRAAKEFPMTETLSVMPICLGAELLEWNPTDKDLCPDLVHHSYEASHNLAIAILDKVATMSKAK